MVAPMECSGSGRADVSVHAPSDRSLSTVARYTVEVAAPPASMPPTAYR